MPRQDDEKFSNRLGTAAKARAEMLAKAKERAAIAQARDERQKQRADEKARLIAEAEAARVAAEEQKKREAEEAKAAAEAKKREEAETLVQLLAEQKAARGARCAARKDRQKKR